MELLQALLHQPENPSIPEYKLAFLWSSSLQWLQQDASLNCLHQYLFRIRFERFVFSCLSIRPPRLSKHLGVAAESTNKCAEELKSDDHVPMRAFARLGQVPMFGSQGYLETRASTAVRTSVKDGPCQQERIPNSRGQRTAASNPNQMAALLLNFQMQRHSPLNKTRRH